MKKLRTILFLLFIQTLITITIYAQGGTWTWISGSSNLGSFGVYGIQGVPSVLSYPAGDYEQCEWKDKNGNFWVYGGFFKGFSDLWKFNPITLEWTWTKGNGLQNQTPIYGTKGLANNSNTPGKRSLGSATWVDTAGNFWLFGGYLVGNALWKYEPNTNLWTWVSGSTILNSNGVFGIKGVPSIMNEPRCRSETSSCWTDSLNNLWLFGGLDAGNINRLNDLWKFEIATNEWTWMSGDSTLNSVANYGIKGISNITSNPGSRMTYTKWQDLDGDFWILGGGSNQGYKNDVWKYQVGINEWVWMNGSSADNDTGNFTTYCMFDSSGLPFARFENRSSVTDICGHFWMFGGFFNDLWVFDPNLLKWSSMSGSLWSNQSGNYGVKGVPALTNLIPSRAGALAWWSNDNKFYCFGGYEGNQTCFSDMWVFDPDTNCIKFDCTNNLAAIANFSSSDSLFCEKQCINFTDISQNNPTSWQWTFNGASPSTSTDQNPTNICYNVYGTYDVTLVACNQFGCDTITKNNFITSYITPIDSIWFVNDTLFALPAYSYQWYEVGVGAIANATQNYYVPMSPGSYYCLTKDTDGCESTSNVILFTSFFENDNNEIANSVWPNPANEILFVNPQLLNAKNIVFEIYDMQGRIILQQMLSNNKNSINISQLATSVYSYRIMTNEKIIGQGRFVKKL